MWESCLRRFGTLSHPQNYLIGLHASERLEERGIMEWQAVDGLADGTLLVERENDKPNPVQSGLVSVEGFKDRQTRHRTFLGGIFAMRIPGKRLRRTKWISAGNVAVAVEVELVIPDADPTEPCCEAETVERLREIQGHADRGELDRLRSHGKVYVAVA